MNIVKIAKYMECMKNHAASIGGNATDGCGEFIPATPESFNCSACGCHRNFHRKEAEGIFTNPTDFYHNFSTKEYVPMMIMPLRKRRLRTKFSREQKERMIGFAERVGWRMKGEEEEMVERFCHEIGVKRRVLKVWMHNNKHHFVRKEEP